MAAVSQFDRVAETTKSTGAPWVLLGAIAGFRAFADAGISTSTFDYCVTDGTDFEVRRGQLVSGEVTSDSLISSSNSNSAVGWGTDTKQIFIVTSASLIADLAQKSIANTWGLAQTFTSGINTNTISERTAGSGVTVDGVLLKDSAVTASGGFSIDGTYIWSSNGNLTANALTAVSYSLSGAIGLSRGASPTRIIVGAGFARTDLTGDVHVPAGDIVLASNKFLRGADTGGTERTLIGKGADDNTQVTGQAGGEILFTIGGVAEGRVDANGFNGPLGQTTPDAGSFSTLDATGQIVGTAANTFIAQHIAPRYILDETDRGVGGKASRIIASDGVGRIELLDDTYNSSGVAGRVLVWTRSGPQPASIDLGNTTAQPDVTAYGDVILDTSGKSFQLADGSTINETRATIPGIFSLGASTQATISSAVITAASSYVRVNSEGGAATDTLSTVNGSFQDGDLLVLKTASNSEDITIDDAGNLRPEGPGTPFTLNTINDRIIFQYDGVASLFVEFSRSNNG